MGNQDTVKEQTPPLAATYASSGVSIEAGNEAVKRLTPHAKRTRTGGVLGGIGGFGALFKPDLEGFAEPILVSATDGVGTKLKVAFALDRHDSVGIDLVAMCANDVLCSGAKPLFFLDYFGTGKLLPEVAENVVKGIADGCIQSDCALIGGETAELPGLYQDGEYDLAGFCVGIVDKSNIIDGSKVAVGDVVIGLSSSGLHSNGYSLARKLLEPMGYDTHSETLGKTVGEAMLTPTKLYVRSVLRTLADVDIHALVHVTGGGFYENIPRVLPIGTCVHIRRGSWPMPPIFDLLQSRGNVVEKEMYTTFNMGIGMVMIVSPSDEARALAVLRENYETANRIGTVEASGGDPHVLLVE